MSAYSVVTTAEQLDKRIKELSKTHLLFVSKISSDVIWETYLTSFPEGTNPIYKERREFDCNCCRHFIKSVGNIITIDSNLNKTTIWDMPNLDYPFNIIFKNLHELIITSEIQTVFIKDKTLSQAGSKKSNTLDKNTGKVIQWNHFYTLIDSKFFPC